jgi:ComF family protein
MKLVEYLYPEYCVVCKRDLSPGWEISWKKVRFWGKEAPFLNYLCLDCFFKIKPRPLECPVCGKVNESGFPCLRRCQRQGFLDRLIFFGSYADSRLQKALKFFKYWNIRLLAPTLVQGLARRLEEEILPQDFRPSEVRVSFIPLTAWRERLRGYNQARELALALSSEFGLKVIPTLKRRGLRAAQSSIKGEQDKELRAQNIQGVFRTLPQVSEIGSRTIWLVDDIYTSGATLQEAARVLKQAGVRQVWGLTIAKA